MKAFKVYTGSWHYRLLQVWFDQKVPDHVVANTGSYWYAVMRTVLLIVAIVATLAGAAVGGAAGIAHVVGAMLDMHRTGEATYSAMVGYATAVVVPLIFALKAATDRWFGIRRAYNRYEEVHGSHCGIVGRAYRKWKSKVFKPVEVIKGNPR